ncbi:MAG: hypothetical protein ACTSVV_06145 [Promethearchaeota archaeon]
MDGKSIVHKYGVHDQYHKFQLLTDASQTLLIIVWRDGKNTNQMD